MKKSCEKSGDENERKGGEGRHPCGKVEIKDALHLVHGGLVWRDEKRRIAGEKDQRGNERGHHDPACHENFLIPPPESHTEEFVSLT